MIDNPHPSSDDLRSAAREADPPAPILVHLDSCLACRVRVSRLREAEPVETPDDDALSRVVQASAVLPDGIAAMATVDRTAVPRVGEIWRVGRDEALLVWVRRVFDDAVADVVPVVLDVELADEDTLLVDENATVLRTEIAAMVSLRTHLHLGAFLNRIGALDIEEPVNEVVTAIREGRRAIGLRTGPPVGDDDDQRLEYRQALRALLAELSPDEWVEDKLPPGGASAGHAEVPAVAEQTLDSIQAELVERMPGLRYRAVESIMSDAGSGGRLESAFKVDHLDEVVLVAQFRGDDRTRFFDVDSLVHACGPLMQINADANALAVAVPQSDWQTVLLTRADMRSAVALPGGDFVGPTPSLEGYGLVDTLCKHLEGVRPVWEVTEPASSRVSGRLSEIAPRRARESLHAITREGSRATQPAKRAAWTTLPEGYEQRVAQFILAVANDTPVKEALAEFIGETRDD